MMESASPSLDTIFTLNFLSSFFNCSLTAMALHRPGKVHGEAISFQTTDQLTNVITYIWMFLPLGPSKYIINTFSTFRIQLQYISCCYVGQTSSKLSICQYNGLFKIQWTLVTQWKLLIMSFLEYQIVNKLYKTKQIYLIGRKQLVIYGIFHYIRSLKHGVSHLLLYWEQQNYCTIHNL